MALRFRATDAPAEVADRTVYDNQATLVLHREDEAWRIVHEHASTPRDEAATR